MADLTQSMREIMFWLDNGGWLDQVSLYEKLGRAQNVGVTLHAMHRRGLLERRYIDCTGDEHGGTKCQWRILADESERAEYVRKEAIRDLVTMVRQHAWEREEPDRMAAFRAYMYDRQTKQNGLPQITHDVSPTIH